MSQKAIYFHAGCDVCRGAEERLVDAFDPEILNIERVDLRFDKARIAEAEKIGIKSVPAVVIGESVHHINCGATIEDLKQGGA